MRIARRRMSSYRFCRTDDIGLLVDALNRCWSPHFPDEPAVTPASFKRLIRDLQVWCSSCMVAFAGGEPIAVLIGAKRPSATLIHRIAVHPDHLRQGHGRHLLTSLSSKLAILGPPRIVAEVPESLSAGRDLFTAAGYVAEAQLTDFVLAADASAASVPAGRFVIPVSIDDLAANGLVGADQSLCWQRSRETLVARKEETRGLAVASEEQIEAYVLYTDSGEILALRSLAEDRGVGLRHLLARARGQGLATLTLAKVHPGEVPAPSLEMLGFRPVARHVVHVAMARSS